MVTLLLLVFVLIVPMCCMCIPGLSAWLFFNNLTEIE